jgi:hypothetical protein
MPGNGHRRRWLRAEDEYLRKSLRIVGYKAAARELGRTVRAVAERASMLGVRRGVPGGRPRTWTDAEDMELVSALRGLSRSVQRPPGQVVSRLSRLYRAARMQHDAARRPI